MSAYLEHSSLFALTVANFFNAMEDEAAGMLMDDISAVTDDIFLNVNWFMNSINVIKTGVYKELRDDTQLHMTLIKLERLFLTNLAIEQRQTDYVQSLVSMYSAGETHKDIVDTEFTEILSTRPAIKKPLDLHAIPGLIGLLSIFVFHDAWTLVRSNRTTNK